MMTTALSSIDAASHAIVQGTIADGPALVPFAREIHLLNCHVAGTSFRDLEDVDADALVGRRLTLGREPTNRHDSFAIPVRDGARALGYVPRERNEVLARLLDAGKLLFARVTRARRFGEYLKIEIAVVFEDQ